MTLRELIGESATAGATASGNFATVVRSYKSKKTKNGLPKADQYLNSDGTVKNALDVGSNLMGGQMHRR